MLTSGQQGLSFRGNWNGDEGTEKNSNFYQLLKRIEVRSTHYKMDEQKTT